MATEWKTPPDADIILRASGGKEFHVHKSVLSLSSPVFRDMFSVPQPTETQPPEPPIIDVHDPPETLEILLQIIYPFRNPPINDVGTLASILKLGDKYDVQAVRDAPKYLLPSVWADSPPLQLYAILCVCGHEQEAEVVARRVPFASLSSFSGPLLELINIEHYHRLVGLVATRDKTMREIVTRHRDAIVRDHGSSGACGDFPHESYAYVMVATIQAAFEENPGIRVSEALGTVFGAAIFFPCRTSCKFRTQGVQRFAERLVGELVAMAGGLSWSAPEHRTSGAGM